MMGAFKSSFVKQQHQVESDEYIDIEMSAIPSRDYFNVFIKTNCNCNENKYKGDHTISYRSNNDDVILLQDNTK